MFIQVIQIFKMKSAICINFNESDLTLQFVLMHRIRLINKLHAK